MDQSLWIGLALAAVLCLLGAWLFIARRGPVAAPPRQKGEALDTVSGWPPQTTRVLTNIECKAFETLRAAFPAHVILAQVPIARFIKVPTRNSYAEWLRRAGQLCADLIVCDRHLQVLAVVELRSPDAASDSRARKRQRRLIRVLKAADIPVHEWTSSAIPSIERARETILPSPADPVTRQPELVAAAGVPAAARPLPSTYNPLTEDARDSTQDEVIEMREPPQSTWFDEMDSDATPLDETPSPHSKPGRR